jgi:hypothetical protein
MGKQLTLEGPNLFTGKPYGQSEAAIIPSVAVRAVKRDIAANGLTQKNACAFRCPSSRMNDRIFISGPAQAAVNQFGRCPNCGHIFRV